MYAKSFGELEECIFCHPPSSLVLFQHCHAPSSSQRSSRSTFFTWAAKVNKAQLDLPEAAAESNHRQESHGLAPHLQCMCVFQRSMHVTLLRTKRNASLMCTSALQALNARACKGTQNALYCTTVHTSSMRVYKPGMVCFMHQPSFCLRHDTHDVVLSQGFSCRWVPRTHS